MDSTINNNKLGWKHHCSIPPQRIPAVEHLVNLLCLQCHCRPEYTCILCYHLCQATPALFFFRQGVQIDLCHFNTLLNFLEHHWNNTCSPQWLVPASTWITSIAPILNLFPALTKTNFNATVWLKNKVKILCTENIGPVFAPLMNVTDICMVGETDFTSSRNLLGNIIAESI